LAHDYDVRFNKIRLREFDGSHLSMPGMTRTALSDGNWAPHQKNAVWRILQGGRPLPSVENSCHVEGIALIIESTKLPVLRPRRAVARNVPAMSPPLTFDGISRVGDANCASPMERLPALRRTFDSRRFLFSAHSRLV